MVSECCCLVQARLLIKYKGHRNHSEKRVMQIIVCFSNKALILHCEWISLREKIVIFCTFLPCVFLKGVSLTLTKRNHSLGNLNTKSATVSLSKLNYFFTLLPGLKPSSNQIRFPEYYDRAEVMTYLNYLYRCLLKPIMKYLFSSLCWPNPLAARTFSLSCRTLLFKAKYS